MKGLSVNDKGNCVCPVTTYFTSGVFDSTTDNYCGKCASNCDTCDNSETCQKCTAPNYFLNKNNFCIKCVGSNFYNAAEKTCNPCPSDCLSCSNSKICTKCVNPKLLPVNTLDTCRVLTCDDGQFWNKETYKCEKCGTLCKKCALTADSCTELTDAAKLNSDAVAKAKAN
jgi:hypothetical protein